MRKHEIWNGATLAPFRQGTVVELFPGRPYGRRICHWRVSGGPLCGDRGSRACTNLFVGRTQTLPAFGPLTTIYGAGAMSTAAIDTVSEPATTKPRKRGKRPQSYRRSMDSYTLDTMNMGAYSDEQAEEEITRLLFADSNGFPKCPKCGCEATTSFKRRNSSRTIFKCKKCRRQFSATSSTMFAYHKLSFKKMAYGAGMFARSNSGVSAIDMADYMKCDYRTAHIFSHKLREAMRKDIDFGRGLLDGVVEADLTEIGGSIRKKNLRREKSPEKIAATKKNPWVYGFRGPERKYVFGAVQRGGNGIALMRVTYTKATATRLAVEAISRDATIHTDLGGEFENVVVRIPEHKTVNHSKGCFFTGESNTNTVESMFSSLKRAERGPYKHISHKNYAQLFADEVAWRTSKNKTDTQTKYETLIRSLGHHSRSRFRGFWQGEKDADNRRKFFAYSGKVEQRPVVVEKRAVRAASGARFPV